MKDLDEMRTLMTRLNAEVAMYGFRTVAAALAQVAYSKADIFRKQLGDNVNAVRWEVTARSIMSACEVIPPYTMREPEKQTAVRT